jgi:hypothetical protein
MSSIAAGSVAASLFRDPVQQISGLLRRRLEFQGLSQRRLSLLGVPGAQQRGGKIEAHQNQRWTDGQSLVPKADGLFEVGHAAFGMRLALPRRQIELYPFPRLSRTKEVHAHRPCGRGRTRPDRRVLTRRRGRAPQSVAADGTRAQCMRGFARADRPWRKPIPSPACSPRRPRREPDRRPPARSRPEVERAAGSHDP